MNPHHLTARTLDRFVLLSLLGEGGMGEVWAARDTQAAGVRIVALKTTKQLGADARQVLFDEARIASLIQHPNVCRVYELGEADGTQYLVMEWCDGASLQDLVMAAPAQTIPASLAVRIAAGVAAGLHAAHELVDENGESLGVVHRDVSPQNVLISTGGVVTITDFGIAKAQGQTHRPTETGEVKGKLSYMAPEQVTSRHVDRRADVFALGCVLYMATLGKRPFGGGDALSTMYQILESEIERPSSVDPNFPTTLEPLLLKALAKEREDRFQTCEEFQFALEGWLREVGQRVSQKEVGAALIDAVGPRIVARNTKIRALSALTRDPIEAAQALEEQTPAAGAIPQSTTATHQLDSRPATRNTSSKPTLVVAGVAVAAAALAFMMSRGDPHSSPHTSPGVVSTAPVGSTQSRREDAKPPSAEHAGTVTLKVSVQPSNAILYLDEVEIGVGQAERREPKSDVQRKLSARLAGYSESNRTIAFDINREIQIELAPSSGKLAPSVAGQPQAAPVPRAPSKPQAAPAPTHPAPSSAWGKPPRPSKKPPRTLDSSNPFAADN